MKSSTQISSDITHYEGGEYQKAKSGLTELMKPTGDIDKDKFEAAYERFEKARAKQDSLYREYYEAVQREGRI